MFEKRRYSCPACNFELQERLVDGQEVRCPVCAAEYRALLDDVSGRASLLQLEGRRIPEPLYLPRGSIRALVALSLAGVCWLLVARGQAPPASLLALLLTVLGYYFGFRRNATKAQSSLTDASEKIAEPLHLPSGTIRTVLMTGFAVAAGLLVARGQMAGEVLAFFLILAGLLVGHVYSRLVAGSRGSVLAVAANHLKGLIVLLATAALVVIYLAGWERDLPPGAMGLLAAVVSFYFGSR